MTHVEYLRYMLNIFILYIASVLISHTARKGNNSFTSVLILMKTTTHVLPITPITYLLTEFVFK